MVSYARQLSECKNVDIGTTVRPKTDIAGVEICPGTWGVRTPPTLFREQLSLSLSFCLTLLALSFSGKCYRALACVAELAAAPVTIELYTRPPPRSLLDRDGVTGIKESWALGFDRAINIITEARFFRKQALSDTLRLPSDLGEKASSVFKVENVAKVDVLVWCWPLLDGPARVQPCAPQRGCCLFCSGAAVVDDAECVKNLEIYLRET